MNLPRVGDRVELVSPLDDQWTDLVPGDRGEVRLIDSLGTVHVRWDNGAYLGLIVGLDEYRVVDPAIPIQRGGVG